MISKCANVVTDLCVKKLVINAEERDIYKYGFELLISVIVNLIWVTVIGVAFNQLLLAFSSFLIFATVRTQSGGYHANTYFKCNLLMIITFSINLFIATHVNITILNRLFFVLLFMYIPIFMWIFAPLSTIQNPIKTEEKRIAVRKLVLFRTILWEIAAAVVWAAGWKQLTISILTTLGIVCTLLVIEIERRRRNEE